MEPPLGAVDIRHEQQTGADRRSVQIGHLVQHDEPCEVDRHVLEREELGTAGLVGELAEYGLQRLHRVRALG